MDPPRWLSLQASAITTCISILMLFLAQAKIMDIEKHIFGPFNTSDINTDFVTLGMTSINFGALQMSPIVKVFFKKPTKLWEPKPRSAIIQQSGRVFFKKPIKLWEPKNLNGSAASFNTSFLFNVQRVDNSTPGEGFTFLIAPSLSYPLTSGKYLGLTDSDTDGNSTNEIVAIEMDTLKEDFDPDDNHIGLDINSARSKVTVPLSQFGFQLAPNGTTPFYVLWVEYDGSKKLIQVYMAMQPDHDAAIVDKPTQPLLTFGLDLKGLVNHKSYFGFSSSTGDTFEMITILRWNLSVEILRESQIGNKSNNIGNNKQQPHFGSLKKDLGVALGIGVALLLVGIIVCCRCRKITRENAPDPKLLGTLKKLPGTPREFSFREIKKATNNFDDNLKLGQGGFGIVFRGTLQKQKLEVAVKMFSRDKMKSTHDFLAELTIINRLRHKNLVPLLGWCHKNKVLLLMYEYMPHCSLDKHIYCKQGTNTTPLSWHLRYKIIVGVASALHYLHIEYDQKVIHRDLKASNIMLDYDFNARLGDFGLARILENEKNSYGELEGVPGTKGYIAPECYHTGKATLNSDVYGFGAVLLEVVCGQRPWTRFEDYGILVDWVWHLHREGRILEAVDQRLGNNYVVEEAERILKLGLACSNPIASERPTMQTIILIISGSVSVPHVAPFKPTFVWPTMNVKSSMPELTTIVTIEHTPINTVCFAR